MYNHSGALSNWVFWRYAVLTAIIGGAVSFFIPYYSIVISNQNSVSDLYSVGKIVFIVIVAVVCSRAQHHAGIMLTPPESLASTVILLCSCCIYSRLQSPHCAAEPSARRAYELGA